MKAGEKDRDGKGRNREVKVIDLVPKRWHFGL